MGTDRSVHTDPISGGDVATEMKEHTT
jgi:hypothetical protein